MLIWCRYWNSPLWSVLVLQGEAHQVKAEDSLIFTMGVLENFVGDVWVFGVLDYYRT